MEVALYGRTKSPHAEVRGRRRSLEARNGGRALHGQGCVLRGSLRSHLRMRAWEGGQEWTLLYMGIKSPHAEVRGRRPSLEARTGSAALHRQGCVLRGSRSLAPQDEGLGGWSGRANFRARQLALCPYEVRNEKICPSR